MSLGVGLKGWVGWWGQTADQEEKDEKEEEESGQGKNQIWCLTDKCWRLKK